MRTRGTLVNCDAAGRFIERVDDPVTKNLLNMAFVRFIKETHLANAECPSCDFDMLYLVKVLKKYFSEHQVLADTLAGEKVGAWFNDEE